MELQTPRFFVAGDQARVGAVIHNNGDAPLNVQVYLDAQGVQLITPAAQSVNVAAKGQAYVTWDLNVNADAQRVDLTAQAVSGSFQDSSKPALGTLSGQGIPVYTYSAVETVGTSGMLTSANSATEAIQLPTTYNYSERAAVHRSIALAGCFDAGQPDLSQRLSLPVHGADHLELPAERGHHARPQAGRPAEPRPCRTTSISR